MASLQYKQWNSWKGGIDDTNQKQGGMYFSHGVDPYRKPGYLSVADSMAKSVSEDDIASFTEQIYWFEDMAGNLFALDSGGDLYRRTAAGTWNDDADWPHADTNTGTGNGLIEYAGALYWMSDTICGKVTSPTSGVGVPTFNDSFKTGFTDSDWHPMAKFFGKLTIGNDRYLATYDGTTWNLTALTLPSNYVVKCLAVMDDLIAIGTAPQLGDDARIFFWDGTSATYNLELSVKASSIDAMMVWSNILWVIAGDAGNLHYYNGATLKEVAKIADVDVESGASVTVIPGGIAQYRGKVVYGVNTVSTIRDRVMPGVWGFDPETGGLSLMFLNSNFSQNTSAHTYAVFFDGTYLWAGNKDSNTGATSTTMVDRSGGAKYTEAAYWTSQWIDENDFANKHFRKLWLNFFEFPASGSTNEITVKYRLDDTTRRLNNGSEYTATGGGASTITIASTTGLQAGDEVTVTGGPSSGDIRKISTVDSATQLTIDRAWTATPVNAQTKFVVERWTELGTITASANANETNIGFDFINRIGKKIQFKIELRDAETSGEQVALSEVTTGYIQKSPR